MSLDSVLFVVVVLLLIWWTVRLPHHCLHQRPTAIRISFSPHGARRFGWRRFWRRIVDTNIQPGEVKHGTLVILDQNGADMPGALFDAPPTLESSDTSIFTVAGDPNDFFGLDITGIAPGVASLTAQGSSGGVQLIGAMATVTVAVTPAATSIDIRF